MILLGHVHQGVVVPDEPCDLPEGAAVRIELLPHTSIHDPKVRRIGGFWKGKVSIADDFDVLPDDIAAAFGMKTV